MPSRPVIQFGSCRVDIGARTLHVAGAEVPIEPKVFDCLAYLLAERDRAVGRDELIAAVWGKVDVSDAMLGQAILKARRAIGDSGRAQTAIRTVPRFGYQWVAPVEERPASSGASTAVQPHATAEPRVEPVASPQADPEAVHAPGMPGALRRSPRARRRVALALAGVALAVVLVAWFTGVLRPPPPPVAAPADLAAGARRVLVLPMQVRSAIADDAWLRLGLVALAEESLRGLPGVVPIAPETAIAAAAADPDAGGEALRQRTGADVLVSSEARRRGDGWTMLALLDYGGHRQQVEAEGADAIATAGVLAERIRAALDPARAAGEDAPGDPALRGLSARMLAALYAGQAAHALELAAEAPGLADRPAIAALRARALLALGRHEAMALPLGILGLAPEPHWRASGLILAARAKLERGLPREAVADLRAAIEMLDIATDRALLARAWNGLGLAELKLDEVDAAEASLLQARLIAEPAGEPLDRARSDQNLGIVAIRRGRHDEAATLFRRAAETWAAFGMAEAEAEAWMNVGIAHLQWLDAGAAIEAARRAGALAESGDTGLAIKAALLEADALAEAGRLTEAERAYAALPDSAPPAARAWAALAQATLALDRGDPAAAIRHLEEAPAADDPRLVLRAQVVRLRRALAGGDAAEAARLAGQPDLRTPPAAAGSLDRLGAAAMRAQWLADRGDPAAPAAFAAALAEARRDGSPRALRTVLVPYVGHLLGAGELADARRIGALLAPCAERDFLCADTLSRLARASGDGPGAARYGELAGRLAGERRLEPDPGMAGAAAADAGHP